MSISLKGYDAKGEEIKLPAILWYEHTIKRLGFEETFLVGFSKNVTFNLAKVIVKKENNKQSECFVDYIELDANKNGFFCRVLLKNIVCRLFENQVAPKIYKTFTLKKMLNKYAKEYDFICNIKETDEIEIENFYVDAAMTPLQVIELYFQAVFKKSVFLTENKNLTFPFSPVNPIYFDNKQQTKKYVDGIKYNYLKMLDDRSSLISNAYIKIVYEDNESEFLNLTEENQFAINCNIMRVKYCDVPKQWQILPKNGAEYMIKKENIKRFLYEIATFEDVDIYPGMLVFVEEINQNMPLLIVKVKTYYNENGKETKIFLRNSKI